MSIVALLLSATLDAAPPRSAPPAPDGRARAVVDTAIARMGGAAALRQVERVRLDLLTQWQRTHFETHPYADAPSYERHADIRDYTILAWRSTRQSLTGANAREFVDLVLDTVAIRRWNDTWVPLSAAYVDERRELFAFAPERVLLHAREAADLRALPDTSIGGVAHARVAATIERYPGTLFFRRTDGFLAMARYRAAQPRDFGLASWGEMEVELWYSRWRRLPAGEPAIVLPTQWDVRRVGRPYKRITVLRATVNGAATPDSFVVSDSLRAAFLATATGPMYDRPLDSARIVDGRLALFVGGGYPSAAVRLGRRWMLIEAGVAPLTVERAVRWLAEHDGGATVAGAVMGMVAAGNGGAAWLAGRRTPLYVAPGARPFVTTVLRHHRQPAGSMAPITSGRWLRVDGDSLRVEPIDLPNAPGALVVYVPALRWVYCAMALAPLELDIVLARARQRGWTVERYGSLRNALVPVPAAGPPGTAP